MMKEEDIQAIRKFGRVLRYIRSAIDPLISTQLAQAFVEVSTREGSTLTELADVLGTNLSTASRQLLDLGERNRKMEPGYQLVDSDYDPASLRTKHYTLTPKGRLLAKEIAQLMKD